MNYSKFNQLETDSFQSSFSLNRRQKYPNSFAIVHKKHPKFRHPPSQERSKSLTRPSNRLAKKFLRKKPQNLPQIDTFRPSSRLQPKKNWRNLAKAASPRNSEFQNQQLKKIEESQQQIEYANTLLKEVQFQIQKINELSIQKKNEHDSQIKELSEKEMDQISMMEKCKVFSQQIGDLDKHFIQRELIRQQKHKKTKALLEFMADTEQKLRKTLQKQQEYLRFRDQCKLKSKELNQELVAFYLGVLKQGVDIKEDGIRWTIKALWMLGEKVGKNSFPKWIDSKSAEFALTIAQKDLELKEYKVRFQRLRSKIGTRSPIFADYMNQVRSRIREMSKSSIGHSPNRTILQGKTNILEPLVSSQLNWVRGNLIRIQTYVKQASEAEVRRVFQSYQNKPVSTEHVLHFLLGNEWKKIKKTI